MVALIVADGQRGDDAMRLFRPLAAALLIPACAPLPTTSAPAPTDDAAYHAIGTEPGWALTIGKGEMRYQGDYGETLITVPAPEPQAIPNGRRYETPRLTVIITHEACNDGMSDRHYPDTVSVTADGKAVRGCGGDSTGGAPVALAGTHWTIASINGTAPAAQRKAEVTFTADRISGSAGCNSFNGGYAFSGGVMTTTQVISTRMACIGPGMDQERAVFAILEQPMTARWQEDDSLILSNDAGTITLKRAE
jgi:heat shock protein HslJ